MVCVGTRISGALRPGLKQADNPLETLPDTNDFSSWEAFKSRTIAVAWRHPCCNCHRRRHRDTSRKKRDSSSAYNRGWRRIRFHWPKNCRDRACPHIPSRRYWYYRGIFLPRSLLPHIPRPEHYVQNWSKSPPREAEADYMQDDDVHGSSCS